MLRAYVLLIGGLIAAPALVVGSLVLVLDGSVPDLSDPRDVLGLAVNAGFSLVIWVIAVRAFRRTMQGESNAVTPTIAAIARFQPVLWLVGAAVGAVGAVGVIDSAHENREALAGIYCRNAFHPGDQRMAPCMAVALECADEVDAGACGEPASSAGAVECMKAHSDALEHLPERDELPDVRGGDYRESMLTICLFERTRTNAPPPRIDRVEPPAARRRPVPAYVSPPERAGRVRIDFAKTQECDSEGCVDAGAPTIIAVEKAFRATRPALSNCLDDALLRKAKWDDILTFKYSTEEALSVSVVRDTTSDDTLRDCVLAELRAVPAPAGLVGRIRVHLLAQR